jgi:hypothetical protein
MRAALREGGDLWLAPVVDSLSRRALTAFQPTMRGPASAFRPVLSEHFASTPTKPREKMSTPTLEVPYPKALERFPTVRQSILQMFDRCALSTAMDLDYRTGWTPHEAARGAVMHRAYEKCLATMAEQQENAIPTDVATAILLECLRQHDVQPRDVVVLPLSEVKDMRWEIVKFAHETTFDIENLVDVEGQLETVLRYPNPNGGWVERVVTGRPDALFIEGDDLDKAIVPDFKSTWGIPPPTELSFDGYFQQRMYGLLVLRTYPSVQSVTLKERYTRFSEDRTATVWRSDIENIEAELAAKVENFDRAIEHGSVPWSKKAKGLRVAFRKARREAQVFREQGRLEEADVMAGRARAYRVAYENLVGLWAPSPGAHCSFCPRPTACPILPQARRAGRITAPEDAERVAAETIVADAVAKQGKDALKVWSDRHGDVPIKDAKGEKVYGHVPVTRRRSPKPEEIRAEFERATLERRSPDIEGLYRESAGTIFKVHAPKPPPDAAPADDDLLEKLEQSLEWAKARKAEHEA